MSHQIPPQHILVVDDEPMVQEALKMVLVFKGHTVVLASDGPEALRKMAEQKFDVVFTDFNMPEMLGDELARCIRKGYPHQVIVMVSAYSNFLIPHHKKEIPVDFFITKPFELQTLLDTLERAHDVNKANRKKAEASRPRLRSPL
ncbi:MAG: response regulator [Verrucomicrobiota bacterium]